MKLKKTGSTDFGWVMHSLCLSIPWLIPAHTEPWPTLYSEIAAGLSIVPLMLLLAIRYGKGVTVDAFSLGVALCSSIPLFQAVGGLYLFPTEAYLVSFYLIGLATTIAVARHTEFVAPNRLPEALFASLVTASIVSTALALAQWTHLDLGPLLAAIPEGTRTVANVGQTNELSTLLVWGLIGLWWAFLYKRIGGLVAAFAAATLLVGIASTQSRTGWLAVGLIYLVAVLAPATLKRSGQRHAFTLLATWFVLLVLVWPTATRLINGDDALHLSDQLAAGLRPKIWSMMIDGIMHRPWFGYGWNQGRMVQLLELPNYSEIKVGIQHAHNLILDLLVWNGLPLGSLIVVSLVAWFVWQLRRIETATQALLILALSTFAIHSMLELPHCKAFFLVPAALMMGILNSRSSLPCIFQLPRAIPAALTVFFTFILLVMWSEYRSIELDLQTYRIRSARVGLDKPAPTPPNIVVLSGLQSALVDLRIEPRVGMPIDELESLRIVSTRYPIESALFRYAKAAFLNGRPQDAQISLKRWCLLFSEERCEVAQTAWNAFINEHPEVDAISFPTLSTE